MDTGIAIATLSAADIGRRIGELGRLVRDCVHAGASINFVLPFTAEDGEAFWRGKVLPAAAAGGLVVLAAEKGGRIAGTVQLDHDTPPNQPHRAEVRKLMVHPGDRRQGIARMLMAAVEDRACGLGRTLLTLDTRTGDFAEPLYSSLGYVVAGIIPDYCRDPFENRLDSTTIMYKRL